MVFKGDTMSVDYSSCVGRRCFSEESDLHLKVQGLFCPYS